MNTVIRLLIRLHPRAFRERFGDGMRECWEEGMRDATTLSGRARFMAVTAVGLVRSALLERVRPTVHDDRRQGGVMTGWWTDLRWAARALLRRPGYAAVAIVTIALGIGANTAIFSLIHGVLLTPLDYEDPESLYRIGSASEASPEAFSRLSMPEIEAIRDLEWGEDAVGAATANLILGGDGGPARRLVGAQVTHPILELFRVEPALGRDLTLEEATYRENLQVVLSHRLWMSLFDGDSGALGRSVELDGGRYEIVGVAQEGWNYPEDADFWIPGGRRLENCGWGCNNFEVVARPAPDVAEGQLDGELRALASRLPGSQAGRFFRARSLLDVQTAEVARGLWILMATVGAVLLIACVNLANLMLVRGQTRRGELAVRAALGAGRGRLLRSVVAEGAILAVVGALLGLAIALGVLNVLPQLAGEAIPRLDEVGLSGQVLGFTAGVTVIAVLLFALLPGLRITGSKIASSLGTAARSSVGGDSSVMRKLLLAGEIALSIVLLVGSGLLLRTFSELGAIDPGYAMEHVVRFDVSLPGYVYDEAARVEAYVRALEDRLEVVPGVRAAAAGMGTPLTRYAVSTSFRVGDRPEPAPGEGGSAAMRAVSPGYFELNEIDLIEGRLFNGTEELGDTSSFLVNETFARRFLADRATPVGAPLRLGVNFGFNNIPGYVVGVVEDVRTTSIVDEPLPEVYVAHAQYTPTFFTMNVRTEPGVDVQAELRAAVAEVDPGVPVTNFQNIREALDAERATTRFWLALVTAFAGLALVLAAVGLYGVIAYLVAGRTREFGVRVALGADRAGIVGLVLADGLRPTLVGLVVGLGVAAASVRTLRGLLHGVEPLDPLTFAAVSVLLLGVAVLAMTVPARRATRVDPVEALRAE